MSFVSEEPPVIERYTYLLPSGSRTVSGSFILFSHESVERRPHYRKAQ
jgi:hypothetical protein